VAQFNPDDSGSRLLENVGVSPRKIEYNPEDDNLSTDKGYGCCAS